MIAPNHTAQNFIFYNKQISVKDKKHIYGQVIFEHNLHKPCQDTSSVPTCWWNLKFVTNFLYEKVSKEMKLIGREDKIQRHS